MLFQEDARQVDRSVLPNLASLGELLGVSALFPRPLLRGHNLFHSLVFREAEEARSQLLEATGQRQSLFQVPADGWQRGHYVLRVGDEEAH